jgi:hypothetical protein
VGVIWDREIANKAPPPNHQTTEPRSQKVEINRMSERETVVSSSLSLRTVVRAQRVWGVEERTAACPTLTRILNTHTHLELVVQLAH